MPLGQAQTGLIASTLSNLCSLPVVFSSQLPKGKEGTGSSHQQTTFPRKQMPAPADTVSVLSSIPPIHIVTVVVISITVFPPDFRHLPAPGTQQPCPLLGLRGFKRHWRNLSLLVTSAPSLGSLEVNVCSTAHVRGELPMRAGPCLWPWQEAQPVSSQPENCLCWGMRENGNASNQSAALLLCQERKRCLNSSM